MNAETAGAGSASDRPVVVKLGGDVLAGATLDVVAQDFGRLWGEAVADRRVLVVHGGGPQATALSERLGLAPRLVGGRRITDAETLDVMKMTVAGKLNVDLVAALRSAGVPAVGLAGSSGIVRARRRPPRVVAGGGSEPVDFGLVGDVVDFDRQLLAAIADADYLPVIACLGASDAGEVLNINADVVASQLAVAVAARALVAVTGVGGVRRDKDDPASRLSHLTVREAREAIAAGVVVGGMIPKLEEAFAPLQAGVAAVHIVAAGEITAALSRPGSVGTLLLPDDGDRGAA